MGRRLVTPAPTDQGSADQASVAPMNLGEAQAPEMSALGVPMDKLQKAFGIMALTNPKSATTLDTIMKMVTLTKPTAAQIKDKLAKQNADRIITELENSYFRDKLHYGNGIKGSLAELTYPLSGTPFGNPNDPYVVWRNSLEARRPFLAKAAGDAGNIALQEQIQAGKPFPNAKADKQTAIKRFAEIRKGFGLPTRKYDQVEAAPNGGYAPVGLEDIGKQFEGK